jgi:exopolysaccharide production protein ExoZ
MFFYLSFAGTLALEISTFWLALPFVILSYWGFWTPWLLCFIAGMIFAKITGEGAYLPRIVAYAIILFYAMTLVALRSYGGGVVLDSLSCLLIPAAVSLERSVKAPKFLLILGDASYSLYLSHPLLLQVFEGLSRRGTVLSPLLGLFLAVPLCCVVSIGLHKAVEMPMVNTLNGLLGGRSLQTPASLRRLREG